MCANVPQVRPWTSTNSLTSLKALWTKEDSTTDQAAFFSERMFKHITARRPLSSLSRSVKNLEMCLWKRGPCLMFSLLLFGFWCLLYFLRLGGLKGGNRHFAFCIAFVKKDRGEVLVTVWGCTYLTVILILQCYLQSSSVNAEISWGAQLHVLHQIDLDTNRSLWTTAQLTQYWQHSGSFVFFWLFCLNRVFVVFFFMYCYILSIVTCDPVHTYLWFLRECDEIFFILLNAEDQVRNGFCLTQKFCLPKERTDLNEQICLWLGTFCQFSVLAHFYW